MDELIIDRLPLVAAATLRRHHVQTKFDTRFRSCARLLQSLWRQAQGLSVGSYTTANNRRRRLGSRLPELAAAAGANFLGRDVATLVRRELAYREPGAAIDEHRVWTNLLSSMPLAFNLFGPLKADRTAAGRFIEHLLPQAAGMVAHIQFEHSPARGDPLFTADATAFDVFISLRRADGAKTFIAIEVKYAEGLADREPRHRDRYEVLSESTGLFLDPAAPDLRRNPLQQLWREHMLAQTLVDTGLYDAGHFIVLAPKLNNEVHRGARLYQAQLASTSDRVPFNLISLEDAAEALRAAGLGDYADAFVRRYLDFGPVHALI